MRNIFSFVDARVLRIDGNEQNVMYHMKSQIEANLSGTAESFAKHSSEA